VHIDSTSDYQGRARIAPQFHFWISHLFYTLQSTLTEIRHSLVHSDQTLNVDDNEGEGRQLATKQLQVWSRLEQTFVCASQLHVLIRVYQMCSKDTSFEHKYCIDQIAKCQNGEKQVSVAKILEKLSRLSTKRSILLTTV
jgi:hypothetical protein